MRCGPADELQSKKWERHSVHAQSPRQSERCAELGRERRLTGSLRFPVGVNLAARACGRNPRKISIGAGCWISVKLPVPALEHLRIPGRLCGALDPWAVCVLIGNIVVISVSSEACSKYKSGSSIRRRPN